MEEDRTCTQCSNPIKEGSFYVINDGDEHYCSYACLSHNYSYGTYLEMFDKNKAYYSGTN